MSLRRMEKETKYKTDLCQNPTILLNKIIKKKKISELWVLELETC